MHRQCELFKAANMKKLKNKHIIMNIFRIAPTAIPHFHISMHFFINQMPCCGDSCILPTKKIKLQNEEKEQSKE